MAVEEVNGRGMVMLCDQVEIFPGTGAPLDSSPKQQSLIFEYMTRDSLRHCNVLRVPGPYSAVNSCIIHCMITDSMFPDAGRMVLLGFKERSHVLGKPRPSGSHIRVSSVKASRYMQTSSSQTGQTQLAMWPGV